MTLLDAYALEHLHSLGQQQWIDQLDERLQIICSLYGLSGIQPIHGGRSGALARCKNPEGQSLVVKFLLPQDFSGQAVSLAALDGRHVPRLIAKEPELSALIMEDLGGRAWDKEQPVDLPGTAQILQSWHEILRPAGLPNQYEMVEGWAGLTLPPARQNADWEIVRALSWALEYSKRLENGSCLLHGDLGRHNLLLTNDEDLFIVDPRGGWGSQTYDAGSLAVWGGPSPLDAPVRCQVLSDLLDLPLRQILGWAAVRAALSAGFAAMRDNHQTRQDLVHLVDKLRSML